VDNTLLDEHIRNNDLGTVDEDIIAINGDREVDFGLSRQLRAVYEVSGVRDNIRHEVVANSASKLRYRHVCEDGADGLEGSIVGDEGSEIGWQRCTGIASGGNSA
jgi:hypothetical protein